jgi:hypothetical protein
MRCLLSPVSYVHQLIGLEESSPAPGRLSVHSVSPSPKSGAITPHYSGTVVDGDGDPVRLELDLVSRSRACGWVVLLYALGSVALRWRACLPGHSRAES